MNQIDFTKGMEVREKLSDLLEALRSIENEELLQDNIDYCLEELNKFKNKEIV